MLSLPNFALNSIKEIRFEYLDIQVYGSDELTNEDISLDFSFKEEFDFEKKNLQIFIHIAYNLKTLENHKQSQLLHSDILFNFEIPTLNDFQQELDFLNKKFLPLPLGISISTVRGIVYTRTLGSSLNQYFLPVLSPMDLVNKKFKDS